MSGRGARDEAVVLASIAARVLLLDRNDRFLGTLTLVRLLTDPRAAQPIGSQMRDYGRAWRDPGDGDDPRFADELRNQSGWRAWRKSAPPRLRQMGSRALNSSANLTRAWIASSSPRVMRVKRMSSR